MFWKMLISLGLMTGLAAGAASAHEIKQKADDTPSIIRDEAPAAKPRARRRGSSSPSPVPPYQSTVRPLGTAPRIVETPPMGRLPSAPRVVPGVSGSTGVVVAPGRSGRESFSDRATTCIHSGMSQGVGAGQIGTFTRSCVNQ